MGLCAFFVECEAWRIGSGCCRDTVAQSPVSDVTDL